MEGSAMMMMMEPEPGRPNSPRFLERLPVWLSRSTPDWLPQQRWFGSKGRRIDSVSVRDAVLLSKTGATRLQALVLLDVHFADNSGSETYFLPVSLLDEAVTEILDPARVIARVPISASSAVLVDGVADEQLRRALLLSLLTSQEYAGEADGSVMLPGQFRLERTEKSESLFPWLPALTAGRSRLLRAEQSNTSMVFADAGETPRLLLKCFRRVMPGLNPDYEITRALTGQTTFRAIPLLAGSILWQEPKSSAVASEPWILGIFQAFIANQGDGWEFTLGELKGVLGEYDCGRAQRLLEAIRLLARRTAELHLALSSVKQAPAIAPEPITSDDLRQWEEQIAGQMQAAAREIEERLESLPAVWRPRAAAVAKGLFSGQAATMPASLAWGVQKVRIHGDYHLGQVLRTDADFVLFDFEGEPARPLAWRRRKWCVLKDVAGMLRSFGYAAHVAAVAEPGHGDQAQEWERSARRAFWVEWQHLIRNGNPALLPEIPEDTQAVLRVFELEKAIYELGYELHHRPDWVGIPLTALERLLGITGEASDGSW